MDMTKDKKQFWRRIKLQKFKHISSRTITLEIIILMMLFFALFPLSYTFEISAENSGENIQVKQAIIQTENGQLTYEGEHNRIAIPYDYKETHEHMVVSTNTTALDATLKINGVPIKEFDGNLLQNNQDVTYRLLHDSLPDYSLEELLDRYSNGRYLILMAVCTDYYSGVTESIQNALGDIGIQHTPADTGEASSFYAVIDQGQLIASDSSNEEALYYKRSVEGHDIDMCSGGQYVGNWAELEIDGKSYCTQRKGLNVAVYDLDNEYLVDSVVYQDYAESMIFRNTEFLQEPSEISYDHLIFDTIDANIRIINVIARVIPICILVLILVVWNAIRIVRGAKTEQKKIHKVWFVVTQILTAVFLILTGGLYWGYRYLENKFQNVTISQLLFHATTNLGGTNWSDFKTLFGEIGSTIAITVIVVSAFSYLVIKRKYYYKFLVTRGCILVAGMLLLIVTYSEFESNYHAYDYMVASQISTSLYEEYYIDPSDVEITFPEKKKNLIYIFLESMEITDSDVEDGGAKTIDYIPELTSLALENECFNGKSNLLNGAYPLGNTGWTVAGMGAQTSGLPLNTGQEVNSYGSDEEVFLPGAYTTGQILEKEGYKNCLMIGSDADFANRGEYFRQHGDFEICDYNWAIKQKKIPEDYFEWWGYEDQKLFEYAKEKVTQLADGEQPFNLTMLTVDTHFTDGYVCDLCEDEFPEQYSNVLACSSRQVAEFINWLKEQDFYDDTVVILSGDHLCMDSGYFMDVSKEYQRRTYVNIINSDKSYSGEAPRTYSTMDMFPTTLSALGCVIQGNRLALGTDLFSDTSTLAEELGKDAYNYQLGLNSRFYKKNILN